MRRYVVAVGEIVGTLAALVHSFARLIGHAADDLRSVGPGPENGTPPSDSEDGGKDGGKEEGKEEGPDIWTGPETYVENHGHRGDELMHAETRRAKWYAEDELKARTHGTRKIGF